MFKSSHYLRVAEFMRKAQQEVPSSPKEPTEAVRLLRAKLIFEEAMETIMGGLGVSVTAVGEDGALMNFKDATFAISEDYDPIETIDGCMDMSVVIVGTLISIGVPDLPFQKLIDESNLSKFSGDAHMSEDGKWIKPSDFQPPDIAGLLAQLQNA